MYYILFLILMMLALFFTKLNFLNSMKKNTQQFIENFKPKYTPHKLLRLNDDNFNPCDNWWNCTKNSSKLGSKWCDGYPSQCSEYRNIIPDSKLNNNNETNKSDSINLSKILKRIPRSLKEELTWEELGNLVVDADDLIRNTKSEKSIETMGNSYKIPEVNHLAESVRWKQFNESFHKSHNYENEYQEKTCSSDLLICPNSAEILNEF